MRDKEQISNDAYTEIKGLKTSIGGYFGGYYEVEIDFDSRELNWEHRGGGDIEHYAKIIRQTTSDKFIAELRNLNLLKWKKEYSDPLVCDGTQWEIEILREKRNIHIYGSNDFPPEWDRFSQLIRKTSGKSFG